MGCGAARGSGRDFLRGHHKLEGNDDVGPAGSDGAGTGVARQQVAQGIRQAAFNPVAHHHPGSRFSRGQETDGGGCWQTHQFILGRRLG